MAKKPKMPKWRNEHAAAVRDPNGPFRPKSIPAKKEERRPHRKRKHKGNLDE